MLTLDHLDRILSDRNKDELHNRSLDDLTEHEESNLHSNQSTNNNKMRRIAMLEDNENIDEDCSSDDFAFDNHHLKMHHKTSKTSAAAAQNNNIDIKLNGKSDQMFFEFFGA